MIPSSNGLLMNAIEIAEQPSRTYQMHIEQKIINGYIDSVEAMKQVVYKILNTERYMYIIYSWNYGIQLLDLFGEHITYVIPELQRRIIEALTWDSRITSVDAFSFESGKGKVHCSFTVHTIYGDFDAEKAVEI